MRNTHQSCHGLVLGCEADSGVNAGISTYFIRAASSTTKIFAIDPLEKPICRQGKRWIDESGLTTYYTGKNFVDLLDIDWKTMIAKKEVDPDSTLVFIDDHLHAFERVAKCSRFGFRHFLVEDNYKKGEGATPKDKVSTPKQYFNSHAEYKIEGDWLFANVKAYAEFPPIVPPIMAKEYTGDRKAAGGFMVASDTNEDIMPPMLRPDLSSEDMKLYQEIAVELGMDPSLKDVESYMQFMCYNQICHLEMIPIPDAIKIT